MGFLCTYMAPFLVIGESAHRWYRSYKISTLRRLKVGRFPWSNSRPTREVSPFVAESSAFFLQIAYRVIQWLSQKRRSIHCDTVEPQANDHPHQRPSLLYDHISSDGQCFRFVRSLTDDHPSNATNDRVRWNFLPREPRVALQRPFPMVDYYNVAVVSTVGDVPYIDA